MSRFIPIEKHLLTLAAETPDQAALIYPKGMLSYQELEVQSNLFASGLLQLGVPAGSRMVLMVKPGPEMLIAAFGLIKSRIIPVLIDPGMGWKNIGKCLEEAAPDAFLGIPLAHAARHFFRWANKTIRYTITVGKAPLISKWTWHQVISAGNTNPIESTTADPDEIAAIVFTSGSTGVPKGVVYSRRIFSAQAELLKKSFGIQPGEVDLATFPLFALYDPALRMTTVFPKMDFTRPGKVNPRNILTPIEQNKVTHMFGSPALLDRVSRYGSDKEWRFISLKRVLSAGAPVSDEILNRFSRLLEEDSLIHTPYGATEALPVASITNRERTILGGVDKGKGVCVGKPLPGVQVRIIKISDEPIPEWRQELDLPSGEIGEIVVSGDNVSRSYFRREEANRLAKMTHPEGHVMHRMGDLGYFDESGRIWFCGRKSHRIICPDRTLFTVPVEGIFNAHPGVFRTALVGVGSAPRQEPLLCVELEPDAAGQKDTIRQELLDMGSRFPITQPIRTILFHPGFPVDIRHNAKIFREQLAIWASEQQI